MINVDKIEKFVPFGRELCRNHPFPGSSTDREDDDETQDEVHNVCCLVAKNLNGGLITILN